jgi:hypothetical protein
VPHGFTNASYWHWEMQNWLARYIGGKPTLAKPTFKTDDAQPEDATKDATKPAELYPRTASPPLNRPTRYRILRLLLCLRNG